MYEAQIKHPENKICIEMKLDIINIASIVNTDLIFSSLPNFDSDADIYSYIYIMYVETLWNRWLKKAHPINFYEFASHKHPLRLYHHTT